MGETQTDISVIEPQLRGILATTIHHLPIREEIKHIWNVYKIIFFHLM